MTSAAVRWLPGAAPLLAAACGGGLPPLPMPVGLAPATVEEATRWADSSRPADNRDMRFRWSFEDEHAATSGGRGRVRLALPDTVRFDAAGPLGAGSTAALVTGDTAIWANPEEDVRKLVPNYPLFWAMLGIARAPATGSSVRHFADGIITAWQFSTGGDTVEYVRESGTPSRLFAEVRQGGKPVGRVETRFGPDGLPLKARLVVLSRPAKLDLTFYRNEIARPFSPDTWIRPAP